MSRKMPDRLRRERSEEVKARDGGPGGKPPCGGSSLYGCKNPVDDTLPYRDAMAFTLDHVNNDKADHRLENLVAMHRACNSAKSKQLSDALRRSESARGSRPSEAYQGHIGSTPRPSSNGSIYTHTREWRSHKPIAEMASVEHSQYLTRRIAAFAAERIKEFPEGIPWREFAAGLADAADCVTNTAEERLEQLTSRANPGRFLNKVVVDGAAYVVPRSG